MGLLDGLTNKLGAAIGTDPDTLLQEASALIQNHAGGLQGVIDKLQQSGLSEQVGSWLGKGGNLPVSADQIQAALGSGAIGAFAQKLGIPVDQAASHLAALLPHVIDHATPDGQPGSPDLLGEGLAALKSRLFG